VANQTDAPPDPCAAVLDQIKEDKAVLEDKERKADLESQEQAAKKAHAADLLSLLDQIDPANTAWESAKGGLMAAVTTAWEELAPCLTTLDASLGDDKDCMNTAYDGYGEQLAALRSEARQKSDATAKASAAADSAAAELADAQQLLSQRYAQFAVYMGQRRDALQGAAQKFKAAMGSSPCDAKTAYILLREAQDIFDDTKEHAAKCLPEEMRNLIKKIDELQMKARAAQTAKSHADDEAQKASAAVDQAVADKPGVILALFAKCKEPPPAPAPAAPAPPAAPLGAGATEECPESPSPGNEPSAKDQW
jgi:uncharacterized phage infection (PIP) family protein YhgE